MLFEQFDELEPDLQDWIRDAVRNRRAEAVVDALVNAGYHPRISNAVQQCLQELRQPARARPPQRAAPRKEKSGAAATSDREVQILMEIAKPRVRLFGNLLSHEECDELIERSRSRLKPSRVVNAVSGKRDLDPQRTSQGTCYRRGENALIDRIERRIGELLGTPVSRGEGIQVLKYAVGEEYRPHYDYFDPRSPGFDRMLKKGGQRCATLIMYLNDVQAGGSTVFPEIGLDILPRKGGGLYFSYADASGNLDAMTLHGGSPVVAGEKWIATKWLRLGDYPG